MHGADGVHGVHGAAHGAHGVMHGARTVFEAPSMGARAPVSPRPGFGASSAPLAVHFT